MNVRNEPLAFNASNFRNVRSPRHGVTIMLMLVAMLTTIAAAQQETTGGGGSRGESPTTRPSGGFRGRSFGGSAEGGFGGSAAGGGFGGSGAAGGGGARGFGGGGFGGSATSRTPVLGEGPTCTFDATVYDLRLSADQIGRLDVAALASASDSVDSFEKALAALGTAKPIYRTDQTVRLAGDRISIGAQSPYVTDTRLNAQGQAMNTISYMNTGAIFSLAGKAAAPGIDLDLNVQVSSFLDSAVTIGGKSAPVLHTATMSHKGAIQAGKPFIVVTVDAGSLDKDGKAVAYIARVIVGEPQSPAAK